MNTRTVARPRPARSGPAPRPGQPARPGRPVWEEQPSSYGQLAKSAVLSVAVLLVLFPVWTIVVTSLASRETINQANGMVVVPRELDITAYQMIFSRGQVTQALWISGLVTVMGTAFSLVLTVLAAYGLSRTGSVAHRTLLFYFLLTFLLHPGLVPIYLVVTGFGLKDNLWALILPNAIWVFNLVVMRAFFMNIPGDLLDSARVDGASEFRILARIVLPLSKAVVAVIGLFYAVGYWNVFFNAVLFIDDNEKWPIQRLLQSYILLGQSPQISSGAGTGVAPTLAIKMAVVVVTLVPVVVVYPFVQRHFVKGVIIGAIKG